MSSRCECCSMLWAVCRIVCFRCYQAVCCKEPTKPRPEYSVIALGLSEAGKSCLLAKLCGEDTEDIKPTVGFSVKAVQLPNAILNIKELGGGDGVRKYWPHYFGGAEAVVFVVDSSADDSDLDLAASELQEALSHPSLKNLPVLILVNKQDKQGARSADEISQRLSLESATRNRKSVVETCSCQNVQSARDGLTKLMEHIAIDREPGSNRI